MNSPAIRPIADADSSAVLRIYQAGLDTGQASFETTAPAWDVFAAGKLPGHRHVAVAGPDGTVLGWVAAEPVSGRAVYAGVVEHSVYIDPAAHGRGVGHALLQALIASTETAGIWTIQSAIFPENTASMRLHERAGFRIIGTRERVPRRPRWRTCGGFWARRKLPLWRERNPNRSLDVRPRTSLRPSTGTRPADRGTQLRLANA